MNTQANNSNPVDVKIVIDDLTKRIKAPADFSNLQEQVQSLKARAGLPKEASFDISYVDSEDEHCIVEDNEDLEMAYAKTLSKKNHQRIKFFVKLNASAKPLSNQQTLEAVIEDAKMSDHEEDRAQQKKNKKANKGLNRKAIKNLIRNELNEQSPNVFMQVLKDKNIEGGEPSLQEGKVVHEHVACDGCGVEKIVGDRFKCSVCKNFDYCATCEERLGHEHPFLKIKTPAQNPRVMMTILGEEETKEQPMHPFQKIMRQMMRGAGHHGRGPCGRGPRQNSGSNSPKRGPGPWGRGPGCGMWKEKINEFLTQAGVKQEDIQTFKEKMKESKKNSKNCDGPRGWMPHINGVLNDMGIKEDDVKNIFTNMKTQWEQNKAEGKCPFGFDKGAKKDGHGKGGKGNGMGKWKRLRALLLSKHDQVLEAVPGETVSVDVNVRNNTDWPWKEGCNLTFANSQKKDNLNIEHVKIPVEQKVAGNQEFTIKVPIKVVDHAIADDKPQEYRLKFRGPGGCQFGERIDIKLRVNLPDTLMKDEAEEIQTEQKPAENEQVNFYKTALKMHEAKLGSFEDCCSALKQNNCDEAAASEFMKRN